MKQSLNPHGKILKIKLNRDPNNSVIKEIYYRYSEWVKKLDLLNSEKKQELKEKVRLLNDYKNFVDDRNQKYFKFQDKLSSSVIEEFLFFLFKDIPELKTSLDNQLIFLGQASAYMNLSFAPKNFKDFVLNAGVYVNKKNQDFTISKVVRCKFENNGKQE